MSGEYLLIDGDSDQTIEHVVRLRNGGIVMTWDDASIDNDANGQGVGLIVFDRGMNLRVNTTPYVRTEGMQWGTQVVATRDGFAVAWNSTGPDRAGQEDGYIDSWVRFFNFDGTPRTAPIQVTPRGRTMDARLQDIELLADGSVAILTADSDVRTDWTMPVYRYDTSGRLLGSGVVMDDVYTGLAEAFTVRTPQAELTASGSGYILTWSEYYSGNDPRFVYGAGNYSQLFTRGGVAVSTPVHLGVYPPNSYYWTENYGPDLLRMTNGTVAGVFWRGDSERDTATLYLRMLDAAGRPIAAPLALTTQAGTAATELTALGGGYWMLTTAVLVEEQGSSDMFSIHGRIFDETGRQIGGTIDLLDDIYEDISAVELVRLDSGELMLTWSWGAIVEQDVWFKLIGDGTDAIPRTMQARAGQALNGRAGADLMLGTAGADRMLGNAGNDLMQGGAGNDILAGGLGADGVTGGAGNDRLTGGPGNDLLVGNAGQDLMDGGTGNDRLIGGVGNDTLDGAQGSDSLRGGVGDDVLKGRAGNDRLLGEVGNDILLGGVGADLLTGGAGSDRFLFYKGNGADTITDFGAADRLVLDDELWAGTLSPAQVIARFARDTGASVVLSFGGGDTITLQGMDALSDLQGHLVLI